MLLRRWSVCLGLLLLIGLATNGLLFGQAIEKGAISGLVLDPTGAAVPGATVKITHVGTGTVREVTSSNDGRYLADVLPVGEYTIEVTASGFARMILRNVRLSVGQNLVQDVSVQVAATGETIEVTAEAGVIDKGESRGNTVISQTYVEELPISGRDFRDFVNLAPSADVTPGLRSPVRLGGQLGEYTGLLIDGVDNRNSFFGEWFGSLETKNFTVPQDAIQEFQVRSNGFSAEFGHATGGLINVVTKSGTNDWHGTAHWFFQNNNLVATTDVPAIRNEPPPRNKIPPGFNTRHQFGGTIGGPIKQDKAFFFFAIDNQKQAGPLTAIFIRDVRSAPCPCSVPSFFGASTLDQLEKGGSQRQDLFAPLVRFDYKITKNNTATTRVNYTRNETDDFTGFAGSQTFVPFRVESNFENFVNEGYAIAQSLTSVIGATAVNEFRASFSQEKRPRLNRGPGPETVISDTGDFGRALFLPIDSKHKRWQFIDNFSKTFGKHDLKLGADYNANATSQVFIGFAGGQYNFFSLDQFCPIANCAERAPAFLLQRVGINGLDALESGVLSDFWQHELSFFVQDNWRIHPRVTLNLGLRWDGVRNPDGTHGLPSAVLPVGKPTISGSSASVSTAPISTDWPDDWNNWAPRIGVAWDVGGDAKTIVRGGFGIYYSSSPTIFAATMLAGPGLRSAIVFIPFPGLFTPLSACAPPIGTNLLPTALDCNRDLSQVLPGGGFNLTYPNLLPSATAPPNICTFEQAQAGTMCAVNLGPPAIDYIDPDFESVRVINNQVGIEREIVKDFSISGMYVYNRTDNLRIGGFFSTPFDRNLDPSSTSLDSLGRTIGGFNLPRLDPNVGSANAITSFGRARYHAIVIQAKKNFSHRYQFGINYTWSRNRDNATSDRDSDSFFGPSDPFNFLALDYGRSQLDIPHSFSAYLYVLLPWDIEFSTLVLARSGRAFPVWAATCSDPGIVASGADVGDPTAGFLAQDAFGNCSNNLLTVRPEVGGKLLPRYPFRNGDFARWDIRFGREFPLSTERVKLRATIEVFNLTDNGNFFTNPFAGRHAILGDPDFKALDQTPGPISAQLGLKLIF